MKTMNLFAGLAALALAAQAQAQCPPASLSPSSAANANVLQSYTPLTFSSSAAGTYSYVAEGLPAGMSLSSAGELSGTPSAAGSGLIRVIGTDTAGCVATRTLPLTVGTAACITLPVGGVQWLDAAAAADFCVNADVAGTEYTLVPVNSAPSSDISLATQGNNIVAVTGPPTPIAPPSGLGEVSAEAASLTPVHLAPATDLPALKTPAQRAAAMIRSPNLLPTAPPNVGDILDIQVAPGCSGTLDIRKGRVESVSPVSVPAKTRLYMVQEVVDTDPDPVATNYQPAVPGGFSAADFDALRRIYEEAPSGSSISGSSMGVSGYATGMLDTLETYFGAETDLDSNDGIVVFFTKWLNELSPPASSVVAQSAFQVRDLYSSAPGSCPRSNEGEIVYMMVPDPTGVVNSNVRTLSFVFGQSTRRLIHETAHLTNAARHIYVNSAPALEETWLDEGLAWIAEELAFFNTSVGLAPRGNIQLSTLTTGPNASRRVAAFNTYENTIFGTVRSAYLQNSTLGGLTGAHMGPLRRAPVTGTTTAEFQYAITAVFLRYAADRLNGVDSAFFNALVNNATSTGVANLQAALGGEDPEQWARDFDVAMYTDDAVAGVDARYTAPSWNYRSVYGGLGGFPLGARPLSDATALTVNYIGGAGPQWLRFGVPAAAAQPALFTLRDAGNPPPATVSAALVRTK